jgi:small subunit ribosomal protein S15
MARMHSRKHGKSGSKRPPRKGLPRWLRYRKAEISRLIIKLAKEGKSPAQIGMILRDQYGIPSVRSITRISHVLRSEGLFPEIPPDLLVLIKKAAGIRKHLAKLPKDSRSVHGLELVESKIRRLGKYYRRKGMLPADWKYEPTVAKVFERKAA